jgi:hypothetical protein
MMFCSSEVGIEVRKSLGETCDLDEWSSAAVKLLVSWLEFYLIRRKGRDKSEDLFFFIW